MKKPLWKFFILLKESSPFVLSIDQYYYFFEAFQQIQQGGFHSPQELRDFCKIFWLKDYEYEREFNQFFNICIKEEELKKLFGKKPAIPKPSPVIDPEPKGKGEGPDPVDPPVDGGDEPPEVIQPAEEKQEDDFVDFDLRISESESDRQVEENLSYEFTHSFTLDDLSIMPFKLRHFAQRLRRKIETPYKEITEELDMDFMIAQYSKNRYIDEIVYRYKDSGSSHVILLADRFGSMLSYEYIEQLLSLAIRVIPDCSFEHYYFKKLPILLEETGLYEMTRVQTKGTFIPKENVSWSKDTWIFILSDAGAHEGVLDKKRMRATLSWWNHLKNITPHVFWLNPVPDKYMEGSTAQRLKRVIPMINPVQGELNKFFNEV